MTIETKEKLEWAPTDCPETKLIRETLLDYSTPQLIHRTHLLNELKYT